jgi:putative nucleotidyltransferase with HDIG domain
MIDRDGALALLSEKTNTDWLVKHCLASEAVIRAMARRLGRDEELWGIVGLLHDLDFDETKARPEVHGLRTTEWLAESGLPDEALQAIRAHNAESLGLERKTELDHALSCSESITGLIVAAALVRPDRKLDGVKPKSIRKRMKEKAFARAVNRDQIRECEKAGVPLEEFIPLALEAMKGISDDLGL